MLALLIVLCFVAIAGATWLAGRRRALPAPLLVLIAVLAPLAAFAYLQTFARPTRSAFAFEVLGQFHSLGDTIRFSDQSSADVVLPDGPVASVLLHYNAAQAAYSVRVQRSAQPVLWGGRPVNGARVGRGAVVRAGADSLILKRPWWCWFGCGQYTIRGPGDRVRAVELADSSVALTVGGGALTVARFSGDTYVIADPRAGVRVDGQPTPSQLIAEGDTLRIGNIGYGIVTQSGQHRVDVHFTRSAGRERWDLPAELEPDARLLVAAHPRDTVPGIAYVLNPAAVAPGAARQPYGGFIERNNNSWIWREAQSGQPQTIELGRTLLLPGQSERRTSGHLVRLEQRDTQPGAALLAVTIAWMLGGAILALIWRTMSRAPLAFRVATIGCLYTLIFIRASIAFRAWLAPPYNARVIVVLLSLLIALPALVALYHYWDEAAPSSAVGRARVKHYLAATWPGLVFPLIAAAAVMPFVATGWYGALVMNAAATLIVGVLGLAVLRRLLIAPHLTNTFHGPLAVLDEGAARDYSYRQFITAVGALAFVGGLFALVAGAMQYGRVIAIAATAFVALGLVWLDAAFTPFVRPMRGNLRIAFAIAGALTIGVGLYLTFLSIPIALIGAAAGGFMGWIAVERPRPRIRPFSFRQAIRPGALAAVSAGLIVLVSTGLLGRVRVLVGYGLAIAGMLVIVRIFAILWFRESDQARRISTRQRVTTTHRLPSMLALATVLVLTLAVYVPLGLTDPGLVLLFFSAAIVAAMIGLATVGWRGVVLGVGMLAVVIGGFFVVMSVRASTLRREEPVALTTAQTRFAAAIHPEALQQQLVASSVPQAREILNTLQQDWGMRYYAALGGTMGRGYFGADFLDRGVTTPVALAENSFGVFVLSEHGWLGGVAVLAAYLALVLVLLVAAAFACDQATYVPRALLLSGLAAFWAIPTLYMVAANASLLPLTGQNVPWLGMLSPADAAFGVLLGSLALHALPRETRGKPGRALPIEARLRGVRKGIGFTALATIALAVLVSWSLWKPLHRTPDDFRLDGFLARIDELVGNRAILPGDTIAVAASARDLPVFGPNTFLTRTIRSSNAIARGERAPSGYCYARDALLRVTTENEIAVGRAFCGLGMGTGSRYAWQGSLRAGPLGDDLLLTNGHTTVMFAPNARAGAVVGSGSQCDAGIVRASSARIGCQRAGALVRFGTSALTFEPLDDGSALLNAKAANGATLLQSGDLIASPDGAHFLVARVPRGAATYARWENGGWRRVASPATSPWLQQIDAQLARALGTRERTNPDALLTLDPELHVAVATALRAGCPRIPGAVACSALLANPHTGAIAAFGEWRANPGAAARYRAVDANLRNHPPASAIKPIMAAAALHAHPKLKDLEVDHGDASYTVVANTNLGDTLRAARLYPNRRVNFPGFIASSDNLYAATLGFLASAPPGRNGLPETRGNTNSSAITVGGVPLPGSPLRRPGDLQLERSRFAEALQELYGVQPGGTPTTPHDANFWNAALTAGALRRGDDLQRISPEAVTLEMDRIEYPRTFASFMIGGASNRWNNVALVQAMSRLFTGTNVELYLLDAVGEQRIPKKPEKVAALQRVRAPVVEGMRSVIHDWWGTSYSALHTAFDPARVNWVGKTGTLAEREWTGSVFLWAGERATQAAAACPTAGIIVIELRRGTNPDGKATALFRDQLAELLRTHRGWGRLPCVS
jgi:hypothetical protein